LLHSVIWVCNVITLLSKQQINLTSLPDAITRQSNLIVRLNTIIFWNQMNCTQKTILWITDFVIRHQSIDCIFSFVLMKNWRAIYRENGYLCLQTAREIHSELNKWYIYGYVPKTTTENEWIRSFQTSCFQTSSTGYPYLENESSEFAFNKNTKNFVFLIVLWNRFTKGSWIKRYHDRCMKVEMCGDRKPKWKN
jgi:hypothetical protein